MLFNVYVDGTWLYRQCDAKAVFASHMEFPNNRFQLDFGKLIEVFRNFVSQATGQPSEPDALYLYTAIFVGVPTAPDAAWGDIGVSPVVGQRVLTSIAN